MRGTEVVNRTRALEEKERNVRESEREERRKAKPTSKSDRPKPNAAYEPYGSPNAQSTSRELPAWMDAHAEETHNERRNPGTAIRPTEPGTLLRRAGLDPDDARVQALPRHRAAGCTSIPRHRSIHVGGFVLTEEPLSTVVPIEPASMDESHRDSVGEGRPRGGGAREDRPARARDAHADPGLPQVHPHDARRSPSTCGRSTSTTRPCTTISARPTPSASSRWRAARR